MTDYTKLVEALRCCSKHERRCLECEFLHNGYCSLQLDAAAAIEALNRLLDQNTQRCEALRKQLRDAHESYENHLNELEAQLPKKGEWIHGREIGKNGYTTIGLHITKIGIVVIVRWFLSKKKNQNTITAQTAGRRWRCRMDRNKVVEKFISARNSDFRFIDMKELVDALMECAIEETIAELDRRVYVAMKKQGLFREDTDV